MTALSKSADNQDKLKAVITYQDGTQEKQEKPYQVVDQNKSLWQRQTLQFNIENKKVIKHVDITLLSKNGDVVFDAVRLTEGRAVEETVYDRQQNHIVKESGLSKIPVTYKNDAFGNVLSIIQGTKVKNNVYDNRDNLVSTTSENGAVITYDVNKKNQIVAKHFEGQDTRYTYHKDKISSIKTADGKTTKYSYNQQTGDLTRIDLPSGKSIVTKFNDEGNIKSTGNAKETLFDYIYDELGNLSSIKNKTKDREKQYTYDRGDGKNTGDGKGRLLSITDYFGKKQEFDYQTGTDDVKTDLLTSMIFDGTKRIYGYDKAARLDKIEIGLHKWLFRHDELGRINQLRYPSNSGTTNYSYGENGALASINSDTAKGNIVSDHYKYDDYGNIIEKQTKDGYSSYKYDAMDQLIEEKTNGKITFYSYDKRGNRVSINDKKLSFNIMNQLIRFGDETITYDEDGNRKSDDQFDYSWDESGQLSKLRNKKTKQEWTYEYDEIGRRISKSINGRTTEFHYDSDTNYLIGESQNGKIIREYIRDDEGQLLGLKVNNSYYQYHKNYRGDIIAITNNDGSIVASYQYDSWGNITQENIKDPNLKDQPFKYASYFYDNEAKQYYLMSRYYNPAHGVFLSEDPEINEDETVEMNNAYSYSGNNPIMKYDSTGKWVWLVPLGIYVYRGYKAYKTIKKAKKVVRLVNRNKGKNFKTIYYKGRTKYHGGRNFKNGRLRQLARDPKQPRHVRGWLKNEQRRLKQKRSKNLRNPYGYDLAHYRGFEASKGFSYKYSHLNTRRNHKLQHKYDKNGKKNKRFKVRRH